MSNLNLTFTSSDPIGHLKELQDQIRKNPQRSDLRIFLFQLYCLTGDWGKAANQLNAIEELDKEAESMVQTYREAVRCEVYRREVFAGQRVPLVLGDPQNWVALMLEAVKLDAAGKHEQAVSLRSKALEEAPATPGKADGKDFEWIADADSRLGPLLEMIMNGKYYWVPMHRLSRLEMEAPSDLRDFVWTGATVTLANGGTNVALIPTRYSGTEAVDNTALRMARATEWKAMAADSYAGVGQRMFATNDADIALLELRDLRFDEVAAGG
ncbi:type VI secretion system accessory protein TagJ [Piscinibacter sakaiensis]|uniref:type VI secretion system accessory protein TagJ n=1 Tax=Piscinibacter sakaiensis TaxID=1547922 RepID=UPI003AACCE1D